MKKIGSFILAFFVLAGTIGAPVSVHHCYSNEITEVGFEVTDSCCGAREANWPGYQNTGCCEFYSALVQVDFEAFKAQFNYDLTSNIQLELPFTSNVLIPLPLESVNLYNDYYDPPGIYGRNLLSRIQSFLI